MPFPLRRWRWPFLATLFLMALFLTAAGVRRWLPFAPIEGIEGKLAWLAQNDATYDTLFIGSSRVFWHIIPREFDAAMAAAGQPTRSFNLGYSSVRPPEDSYVLEKALAGRKAPLRYVVVEADEVALEIRNEVAGTARLAYWHDLRRMRALISQALAEVGTDASWWANLDERRDAFRLLGAHLRPFLEWASNLGRGEALLSKAQAERDWDNLVGVRRDGFTEEKDDALSAREAKRLRTELKKPDESPTIAFEASQDLFADMERRIAATGARMIVIVPPRTGTGRYLPDPQRFPHLPVFDFSDQARYPELFEARHRYDSDHLNLTGAGVFTRLLAARLLALR
jgi:hypothetical protein